MDQLYRKNSRGEDPAEWAGALVEMFQFCCRADLSDGSWSVIKEEDFGLPEADGKTFFDAMRLYSESHVFLEDRGDFVRKLSKEYITANNACGDYKEWSGLPLYHGSGPSICRRRYELTQTVI